MHATTHPATRMHQGITGMYFAATRLHPLKVVACNFDARHQIEQCWIDPFSCWRSLPGAMSARAGWRQP